MTAAQVGWSAKNASSAELYSNCLDDYSYTDSYGLDCGLWFFLTRLPGSSNATCPFARCPFACKTCYNAQVARWDDPNNALSTCDDLPQPLPPCSHAFVKLSAADRCSDAAVIQSMVSFQSLMLVQGGTSAVFGPNVDLMQVALGTARNARKYCPFTCRRCKKCGVGSRLVTNSSAPWFTVPRTCIACGPGKFTFVEDEVECRSCSPGSFNENSQSSKCDACPSGQFTDAAGATNCTPCSNGTFAREPGHHRCHHCSPGWFQDISGSSECRRCPRGSFANDFGQSECAECIGNTTTAFFGAVSGLECQCPALMRHNGDWCERCTSVGLHCPGGFSPYKYGNGSERFSDTSPQLLPGFMSMPDDPLSVYLCQTKDHGCQGTRSPYQPEHICNEHFQLIARCGTCKEGYFETVGNACRECSSFDIGGYFALKCLAAIVVALCFSLFLYFRVNRPNPAGLINFSLVLSWCQLLFQLHSIPLAWPQLLDTYLRIYSLVTFETGLAIFNIRIDCASGPRPAAWKLAWSSLCNPGWTIVLFLFLDVGAKLVRRPLRFEFILNCVGNVFKTLFVTIAALCLTPFITDPMPNGKDMVKSIPGLERFSDEWFRLLPISIASLCFYCIGFYSWVAYAVWRAPQWASVWPAFGSQFRFAFGAIRPDCWWCILVMMGYQFVMTMMQMGFSSHARIYNSSVLLVLMLVFMFSVKPFKFRMNNSAWLSLQCSLLIFLILATSFPDLDFKSQTARDEDDTEYAVVCIIALSAGLAVAVLFTLYWAFTLIRPVGLASGRAAKLAFQFRDVNRVLALIPNQEFLAKVRDLGESDLKNLEKSLNTLVAIFLNRQPSKGFFGQRLMANVPYRRWQPQETMLDALDSIFGGELHRCTFEDAEGRLGLLLLCAELRDMNRNAEVEMLRHAGVAESSKERLEPESGKGSFNSGNFKLASVNLHDEKDKALDNFHRTLNLKEEAHRIAEMLDMTMGKTLDRDAFIEKVRPWTSLRESDLERAFALLDMQGKDKVGEAELVPMLVSAAPPLSDKLRGRLLQTKSFAHFSHASMDEALGFEIDVGDLSEECEDKNQTRVCQTKSLTSAVSHHQSLHSRQEAQERNGACI